MLLLERVSYQRGERLILNNINLQALPGELVQIVGVNGAGKSTLLKIIAGVLRAQSGQINWQDVDANKSIREEIIYLGHIDNLHPRLTVKENLIYLRNLFFHLYPDLNNLAAVLNWFNLVSLADERSGVLSAGQRQRVSLARLVGCRAKLWLLDEVSVNLDHLAQQQLYQLCDLHLQSGGTIIVASHTNFAAHMSSRKVYALPEKDIFNYEYNR